MITAEELRAIPLFAGFAGDRLAYVSERAADIPLDAGEYLAQEGESASFFVIVDGTLEITKRFGTLERVLGVRGPGDTFGEVPLVLGAPILANARAATRARVMRLDAVTFGELVRESPVVSSVVMHAIARRVRDLEHATTEMPPADAVIVGRRYDPACHDVRDFMARNQVRFDWYEPGDARLHDVVPEAPPLIDRCPLVRTASGELLVQPRRRELACAVGLPVDPKRGDYDLIITGGGPAGLAAAVYGASEGLRTLMVEREAPGGQAGTSSRIENYLGFPAGLSGSDLGERALRQAQRLGAEIVVTRSVIAVEPGVGSHAVRLDGDDVITAQAIVLANGVTWRHPPVDGIESLIGRGVYYGAARTEAIATRGKDVYLLGGGNSAGQAALFFSEYARTVTLIVRNRSLEQTMSRYLVERIEHRPDVFHVRTRSEVVAVEGSDRLEAIRVRARDGEETRLETDLLFVFIGADPETGWMPPEILRDGDGYVLTGPEAQQDERARWPLPRGPFLLETSVPGIFAAGDVRHGSIKRVAAAVGEGSMAIAFVHRAIASPAPA